MGKKKLKTSKKDLPDDGDAHVDCRPDNDPLLDALRKHHIERDPRYGSVLGANK